MIHAYFITIVYRCVREVIRGHFEYDSNRIIMHRACKTSDVYKVSLT